MRDICTRSGDPVWSANVRWCRYLLPPSPLLPVAAHQLPQASGHGRPRPVERSYAGDTPIRDGSVYPLTFSSTALMRTATRGGGVLTRRWFLTSPRYEKARLVFGAAAGDLGNGRAGGRAGQYPLCTVSVREKVIIFSLLGLSARLRGLIQVDGVRDTMDGGHVACHVGFAQGSVGG